MFFDYIVWIISYRLRHFVFYEVSGIGTDKICICGFVSENKWHSVNLHNFQFHGVGTSGSERTTILKCKSTLYRAHSDIGTGIQYIINFAYIVVLI